MPTVWALIDDRTGDASQVMGVAEILKFPFEIKTISYLKSARLPTWLRGDSLIGIAPQSRADLKAPWPDLVIGCGRRTVAVARWIKRQSGGRTKLAQIMWPGRLAARHFDLIAAPRHDGVGAGANVLEITGAPHRVTPERLAAEGLLWRDRFAHLPRPWIAVLVGGALTRRGFTSIQAGEFGAEAARMARETGGSLLVSTSRRTGPEAEAAVLTALEGVPSTVYRWSDGGENPFFGYLGTADAIVITGDSTSMCCEACATGKPVFIYATRGLTGPRHERMHAELFALGHARPLLGAAFESWTHLPLNAAHQIAEAIRKLL